MLLSEWIEKNNKTQQEVADALGCGQCDISRYCSGEVIPRPDRMQKITEYTNGGVTPNDFYKGE